MLTKQIQQENLILKRILNVSVIPEKEDLLATFSRYRSINHFSKATQAKGLENELSKIKSKVPLI